MKVRKYKYPFRTAIYKFLYKEDDWTTAREIKDRFGIRIKANLYRTLKGACERGVLQRKTIEIIEEYRGRRKKVFVFRMNPTLLSRTKSLKALKILDEEGNFIPIERVKV